MNILNKINIQNWAVLGLFNLTLVAASGLLMRLKLLLPIPAVNQKFLLHAHSHFAFSGWISHLLMVLLAAAICSRQHRESLPPRYQTVILVNVIAAYGMLASFLIQGYALYSIFFSSLTVMASYFFAAMCWRDMAKSSLSKHVRNWFSASLFFLIFSSAGVFFLAYLMATKNTDTRLQLATVYFFLHFQYNGWFLFACMGLFHYWLQCKGVVLKHAQAVFTTFALICIPAYILSVLWWNIPNWLYAVVLIAVIAQAIAWVVWLRSVIRQLSSTQNLIPAVSKWLFYGVATAVSIKVILQGLSVIPSLSQLAYSFRPIVIGYLHLILLAVISLFIISYAFLTKVYISNRVSLIFVSVFVAGIILNELFLMIQGISGLTRVYINHIPVALAGAAILLVIGATGLACSQLYHSKSS
ncbi:hypothetical protein EIM50_18635 [Pseudoxanthomonas sp. SGD-10]|nr:hypothetical protein EIM50_18635 [Pseudoxanthomonas sp. SGD-10]